MRRLLLILPLAALALAGCSLEDDGPKTTQTRDVPSFNRIDSAGSVDLKLRVGQTQRVEVRAGEKVIDDVRTEVRDGTLHVDFDHSGFGGNDVVIDATVPKLTGVVASGSGDIDAAGVKADAFAIRSTGSADIDITGTAGSVVVDLDGSGDSDLSRLNASEARVAVRGSGDVDVRAANKLDVEIDGSGDVSYRGDPALTRRVDGSGDVKQG